MKKNEKLGEIILVIVLLTLIALCWVIFSGRVIDPADLKFIYQDF